MYIFYILLMNNIIKKEIIVINSKEDVNDFINSLINNEQLDEEIKYEIECKYLNQMNYESRRIID